MKQQSATPPWWTFGHLWLVIAGPAIVVVAAFVTLYLAIRTPDPVLTHDTAQDVRKAGVDRATEFKTAPAQQARNHAATGAVPTSPAPSKP